MAAGARTGAGTMAVWAGSGAGTMAVGARTGAGTMAVWAGSGDGTMAAGACTGAQSMASGGRAASLDLRLLLLGAFWRLRGPPKARRVPENGSWTGAGNGEEAGVDSRRNTPRCMVSGWELGGRGLACLGLAGRESHVERKSKIQSGKNLTKDGSTVATW